MKHLTPEDYKIAESNGISREVAYKRYYKCDMTREQAITRPVGSRRRRKYTDEIIALAESNNIPYPLFVSRVNEGWSWLAAATDPVKRNKRTDQELLDYYRNRVKELESRLG